MDPIAQTDQLREHARRHAQIAAAFFNELNEQGVPAGEASWITRDYLEYVVEDDELTIPDEDSTSESAP
jgi:hypothetical protein